MLIHMSPPPLGVMGTKISPQQTAESTDGGVLLGLDPFHTARVTLCVHVQGKECGVDHDATSLTCTRS